MDYIRDVIKYQTAGDIAAIIVEPCRARRQHRAADGFLRAVKSVAEEHGALLLVDEMITGRAHGPAVGPRARRVIPDI